MPLLQMQFKVCRDLKKRLEIGINDHYETRADLLNRSVESLHSSSNMSLIQWDSTGLCPSLLKKVVNYFCFPAGEPGAFILLLKTLILCFTIINRIYFPT